MKHSEVERSQMAAAYVAHRLEEAVQESFELHMMECPACVAEVEAWRAIKAHLPVPEPSSAPAPLRRRAAPDVRRWQIAAAILAATLVGGVGGWMSHTVAHDSSDVAVFFNLPPVSRAGDECLPVRLAADTRLVMLRVPGIARTRTLHLADPELRELRAAEYTARIQPDGSQLVRLEAAALRDRPVVLQTQGSDGSIEPLACIVGAAPLTD